MIRMAYKMVKTGGVGGSVMTEELLEAYVLDAGNEISDTMLARINYNNLRR